MTLRNLVDRRELERSSGDSARRDNILISSFSDGQRGLNPERLGFIRTLQGTLYERVRLAAEILFESLQELGVRSCDIGAQFTLENLAALIYREWDIPENQRESLRVEIRRRHRRDLEDRLAQVNFRDLSYAQLFRETISLNGQPLYQGNLYDARRVWRNFQPSNEDFLLNARLPLAIGPTEAFLLGVYWADGYLRKGRKSLTLVVEGEHSDLDLERGINFYGDVVALLLRDIHNYHPLSAESYIETITSGNGTWSRPFFDLNSAAICTWLRDDLKFPPPQRTKGEFIPKRVPFEYLIDEQSKRTFFAGVMAGLGIINGEGKVLFQHIEQQFLEDLAELAKIIGYAPSEIGHRRYPENFHHVSECVTRRSKNPIWYFTLPRDNVAAMHDADIDMAVPHIGMFFNPKHSEKFTIN